MQIQIDERDRILQKMAKTLDEFKQRSKALENKLKKLQIGKLKD